MNFDLRLKSTFIPKMFGEVLKAKIRQYLSCVTDLCCLLCLTIGKFAWD